MKTIDITPDCTVVNKYKEDYDEYIGRGSVWGNNYSHKEGTKAEFVVSDRDSAIDMYESSLRNNPSLWLKLRELKGKKLGCYCKPNTCHGDVIAKYVNILGKREWSRRSPGGYEVSSVGDKRFSAFNAKIGGKSIEYLYQVRVKGYNSIKEGKGKPPHPSKPLMFQDDNLWLAYRNLWEQWSNRNPALIMELAMLAGDSKLTDCFANTDVNQARALTYVLNTLLI